MNVDLKKKMKKIEKKQKEEASGRFQRKSGKERESEMKFVEGVIKTPKPPPNLIY